MSIVPLRHVTVVGLLEEKDAVLADLQEIGCLHLEPLGESNNVARVQTRPSAAEALRFLLACPGRRRQADRAPDFDPERVEREALRIKEHLEQLRDERDHLTQRIEDLEIWGDFELSDLEQMEGWRLWFYVVPNAELDKFDHVQVPWEVVHQDSQQSFVVLVSREEPADVPVARVHLGARPRSELEARLDEVELEIDRAQAERRSLSRWCFLFAKEIDRLEDREVLHAAAGDTTDDAPLFGLEAWAPAAELPELEAYADRHGLLLQAREAESEEIPPTLLENGSTFSSGEDLVTFYMIPGYDTWDPSSVVFVSFVVFFAMIFSDAGYGALLGLGLLFFWGRMGESRVGRRLRILGVWLTTATIVYGVLVGGYFGLPVPEGGVLHALKILDPFDETTMMTLSVVVGVAHLTLANLMDAWRMGFEWRALAPVGWAIMLIGGLAFGAAEAVEIQTAADMGAGSLAVGAFLVVAFTEAGARPLARLMGGLLAVVSKFLAAFGDVLSYLRLFALGIATGSLAIAFNGMAHDIREGMPGVGLLFAAVVLIVGHTVNLVLAVMSGVVHGLRLNVIEFLKWGVPEEGRPYRAFSRKEGSVWTT